MKGEKWKQSQGMARDGQRWSTAKNDSVSWQGQDVVHALLLLRSLMVLLESWLYLTMSSSLFNWQFLYVHVCTCTYLFESFLSTWVTEVKARLY